ncbi:MAG: glycosyltransferase [Pseudomonadales bacterium]|nr:glycosyltransferase [Pseudomonadales bacterium]
MNDSTNMTPGTKPKINWFSPLLPDRTDIAHYTYRILPALAAHFEVTLWAPERCEFKPYHDTPIDGAHLNQQQRAAQKLQACIAEHDIRVKFFNPAEPDWYTLNSADLTFYNIGNNRHFHSEIWQISQLKPGIVIMHDHCVFHLIVGALLEEHRDQQGLENLCRKHYGPKSVLDFDRYWNNDPHKPTVEDLARAYPFDGACVTNATAIITHTQVAADKLRHYERPLLQLPLPYDIADTLPDRTALYDKPAHFELVIFGYLGTNRRVIEFLNAFAQHPHREAFRLRIFGEIWNPKLLTECLKEHSLTERVMIEGFVEDETLDNALRNAHLVINLRYPSMGEASGSQLRLWNAGLPSLVTNVGYYATLPDDAVIKIDIENEAVEIQKALTRLLETPEQIAALGVNGFNYLRHHHQANDYAVSLKQFTDSIDLRGALIDSYAESTRQLGTDPTYRQTVIANSIAELVNIDG